MSKAATKPRKPITIADKLPKHLKVPAGSAAKVTVPAGIDKPSGITVPAGVTGRGIPMPTANGSAPKSYPLPDGQLRFRIQDGPNSGRQIVLDAMLAKLACEPVEAKHGTWATGWKTTAEFLTDLAKAVEGLGVPNCSPSLAYAVWSAAMTAVQEIHRALTEAIGRG